MSDHDLPPHPTIRHELLERQIRETLGSPAGLAPEVQRLLDQVSEAYDKLDAERARAERVLRDELERLSELLKTSSETRGALYESRQRYQALTDNSPIGIFHSDTEGKTVYVNRAWCELTGLTEEEALADSWRTVLHPEDRARKLSEWSVLIDHHQPIGGDQYRLLRRDGRTVWVEGYAVPLRGDDGRVVGYIGSIYDISGHKEAERIRRTSEERYRALFEQSHDVIYTSTIEGRFLDVNQAGVELFGYGSKEELLEADLGTTIYRDPADRELLVQELLDSGMVRAHELRLKTRDSRPLTVLASIQAVTDDTGNPVEFRGILHDVTETKHLERQLGHSQKMEAIGRLAGGVAHDFNNLLTAILGYSDLIRQDHADESVTALHAGEIRSVAKRGAALTQQLLAFSKRQRTEPRVLEVNRTVEDLRELLARLIGEDVDLRTELDSEAGTIEADPSQIEQILVNLAVNARDAMPGGGILTLTSQRIERLDDPKYGDLAGGPWVRLAVRDTGSGIPDEALDKIFEPFYTTKPDGRGTGLGLATVYGAVQQNGGRILVDSSRGQGTTFEILLPASNASATDEEPEVQEEAPTAGHETVLLAEDEPAVRSLLKNALVRNGYRVLTAANGAEALEIARAENGSLRLLVSDVVMPKLNGIDLARAVRAENGAIRIVLLTGYAEDQTALEEVSDSLLIKPFAPQELARKARELLDAS